MLEPGVLTEDFNAGLKGILELFAAFAEPVKVISTSIQIPSYESEVLYHAQLKSSDFIGYPGGGGVFTYNTSELKTCTYVYSLRLHLSYA